MTIKKIYSSSFAPNPLRVNYMLKLKGIELDYTEVDMMKGEQLLPDYKKISPEGTLPALILDDGSALTDVTAMLHYIEQSQPDTRPLMGETILEQAHILGMIHRIYVTGLMSIAEVLRNGFMPGFENRALAGSLAIEQIPELMTRGKKRLAHFYTAINETLGNNEFLINNKLSQADIDLFVCCRFAGFIKQPLTPAEVPALAAHYARMEKLLDDATA